MRYQCIDRRRTRYPVRLMCRLLKVSPSGYYAWRVRPESRRAAYDRELTRAIRRLHAESDGTYGSPRIHAELIAEGFSCGRVKVARLMRQAGLKGCPKRRFRVTSRGGYVTANNLLAQDFTAEAMNQRWASDITFIWTGQGWLYLAVVMDLYSRRIVGWSMSRRISRHLVLKALASEARHGYGVAEWIRMRTEGTLEIEGHDPIAVDDLTAHDLDELRDRVRAIVSDSYADIRA